ncbi:MAG: hypothetical protein JNN01_00870 [Opitutaceae bacterium]|nr:hypothetical protein [Opitutaceae bacterium]
MESPNLSPLPPDDAHLDAWLRTRLAQPPLPDAGFTVQLTANLPPRPIQPQTHLRLSLCLAAAAAGLAVVVWNAPAWESVSSDVSTWGDRLLEAVRTPSHRGVLVGVLVSLASVVYALKPTQETG